MPSGPPAGAAVSDTGNTPLATTAAESAHSNSTVKLRHLWLRGAAVPISVCASPNWLSLQAYSSIVARQRLREVAPIVGVAALARPAETPREHCDQLPVVVSRFSPSASAIVKNRSV